MVDYNDDAHEQAFETTASTAKDDLAKSLSTPDTIFQKAVVEEVINDPAAFKNQAGFSDKYSQENVTNFQFINRISRNSILAKVVNDGQGKRTESSSICLPFFPPHLCFPVKPGEHVWLISPTPIGKSSKVSYWMCRVPTWDDVDDINYTHEDRFHHSAIGSPPKDAGERRRGAAGKADNATDANMFGFPNGTAEQDGFTVGDEENAYDTYATGSLAYKNFKPEPVPRYTKMPGDLVLQGSNNSSITLGTNRGFKGGYAATSGDSGRIKDINDTNLDSKRSSATIVDVTADPISDASKDLMFPAIDLVAGRGLRNRPTNAITHPETDSDIPDPSSTSDYAPTYPRIKKTEGTGNDRGHKSETSKNPQGFIDEVSDNMLDHPVEGDPDFRYDASRVFLTAGAPVDSYFGLPDKTAPTQYPTPALDGASVAIKSDHVRIIARKDPDDAKKPVTDGSIRIIKEGGDDLAVISIEGDGTIRIDAKKIVIGGTEAAANGSGEQVFIGETAQEPMVLGNVLVDLLSQTIDAINAMTHPTGTGPSGTPINAAAFTAIKNQLNTCLSKVGKLK